jgi:DnaJ-domain-containing protein 1
MRLRKSKTNEGYQLTFDITPQEAQRVELFLTWNSSDIKDYVDDLQEIIRLAQRPQRQFYTYFTSSMFGDYNNYNYQQQYTNPQPAPPIHEPAWVAVLGLKRDATPKEIKSKYRELAKKNHPDKGGDPVKFAKIQQAYEEAIAHV